jgi:hypothetical protein
VDPGTGRRQRQGAIGSAADSEAVSGFPRA